ncbi:MAG: hypothetical protein K0A95_10060 [Chromatiales bacterium]|nr:hypothetical protein [Chromatiales bacterium]
MNMLIKRAMLIVIFCFSTYGVAVADIEYERLKHIADDVVTNMPSTWRVIEEKTGVIPYGHYDGLKYDGQGGLSLVLIGPQDMYFQWRDEDGAWHQKAFHKEVIELWFMPPEYHLSWKRFFVMKSPAPADHIYSGVAVKVYGMPSRRSVSPHQEKLFDKYLEEILSQATTLGPRLAPLSWATWKMDIKKFLQQSEQ